MRPQPVVEVPLLRSSKMNLIRSGTWAVSVRSVSGSWKKAVLIPALQGAE
jgi:hypothetical protein